MTIYTLPTFSDPFYTQRVTLDGQDFNFTFKFNFREGCWYFDLATADDVMLQRGAKIVCGYNLINRIADLRRPGGDILAYSNTDDDSPPGLDELGAGKRVVLYYYDRFEYL